MSYQSQSIKTKQEFKDPGSERALLGTIVKNGRTSFLEADEIVASQDFSIRINKAVYASLKDLYEDQSCDGVDIETLKLKMNALGFNDCLASNKDIEYIELLSEINFNKDNVVVFAKQIKKYAVLRELYSRYKDAASYLETTSPSESLSSIIANAENKIVDFINGTEHESLKFISDDIDAIIKEAVESEPVDQIGLPSGFPRWDSAIGGGLRRSTVNITVARAKKGKSFDAMNIALNIAKLGIPVLYLDTELTYKYQIDRMTCIDSECPIKIYETKQFKNNPILKESVIQSAKRLQQLPMAYHQIGGMTHVEALAIARKWISKSVGFNNNGKANDCLIIYDYFKLTGESQITKNIAEHIALGLMLTDMHNFALRYDIPILGYVQSNRDGIESDETNIIAGSDRILWLCSSMSVLRDKDQNDDQLQCGWEYGNKKKIVIATRYGPGFDIPGDYINIKASLNPKVSQSQGCGKMVEGFMYSECVGLNH